MRLFSNVVGWLPKVFLNTLPIVETTRKVQNATELTVESPATSSTTGASFKVHPKVPFGEE